MPRVRLIEEREDTSPSQVEAFDHIAASRGGQMIRPFAAMIHRPEIARAAADLGAVIRFESTLSDRDREIVICTTAIERDCPFEWESHTPIARRAGVPDATLQSIESGMPVEDADDALLVDFTRELCRNGKVGETVFERVWSRLDEEGTVELAAVIGYYTMLALFMNACDAC
ncbi:MAG TPA: carboxymuconolactone decarboxylase family protein [Acidimicrobiia bacterium]|jgi:4-carboxymuconolactone decarboxylase|nr:carboxymuconolactone decarboxylase family protein [Acidimicrobiia bacterium]